MHAGCWQHKEHQSIQAGNHLLWQKLNWLNIKVTGNSIIHHKKIINIFITEWHYFYKSNVKKVAFTDKYVTVLVLQSSWHCHYRTLSITVFLKEDLSSILHRVEIRDSVLSTSIFSIALFGMFNVSLSPLAAISLAVRTGECSNCHNIISSGLPPVFHKCTS